MARIQSVLTKNSKIFSIDDIVQFFHEDDKVIVYDTITGFYDLGQKALLLKYDWVDCDDKTLEKIM